MACITQGACQRTAWWPNLEAILFEWQKDIEEKAACTGGDLLILKAREICPHTP